VHRFYVPDLPSGGVVSLPEGEARHLARVLRLGRGDLVAIFDGRGRELTARVESIESRNVAVELLEARTPAAEPGVAVTFAQALLKSDKMDRVIGDAVMLGATAIQPFVTRRTDVPASATRSGVRHERWARSVIAAVKQCGRAVVPPVLATQPFSDVLTSTGSPRLIFVEPAAASMAPVTDVTALDSQKPRDVVVMIGPEGGWDPGELREASAAGATLVTLGSRVLRADAAGAVALAVLRYLWRDL
jgi:16S rRNA (uracil1498-N3)-methyltransferase